MLKKIKRQDCLERYPSFPVRDYDPKTEEERCTYPRVFRSYILTLPLRTATSNSKALGLELSEMASFFSFDTLIFLGDTQTPWLQQENPYKPAKEAQQYLRGRKIGKLFNGALEVDKMELPAFIRPLTWLTRCNAAFPQVYFVDPKQELLGNICLYGNLHLDILNEQADQSFLSFLTGSRFQLGDHHSCHNRFGRSGAIPGRQFVL